jgi:single-stranded-DNA-specific exonuclease
MIASPPVGHVRPPPRWIPGAIAAEQIIQKLAGDLHLPTLVCSLLSARGYSDVDAAKSFLRPRLEQLHSPLLLSGMEVAIHRLSRAIRDGETIMVHGDYDVDGICSTTILVHTIRQLGGTAVPFIPNRLRDGYDLSDAGVRAAVAAGARVVVTCDCGTSAHKAVADLRSAGIDVIISDHHLPSGAPPECLAVLNPRLPGNTYPDRDLCAAGVAFKLAVALLETCGGSANVALRMLDLVALATVADVVPLRGENRIFVRYGLRLMQETRNVGLRALIAACGLEGRAITAGRIGFLLAPRLNAVGRLDEALRGVELLLSTDVAHANRVARDLEELNRTRQAIDRDTLESARKLVDSVDIDTTFGLVLAAEGWHAGVIGIVASRLVEELCRPVVLIAVETGIGKGSGRSIPAFDLHGGLLACHDTLLRFGGHRAAAGLTIDASRIGEFAQRFNDIASQRLTTEDLVPELRVDAEVPLADATETLERLVRHFEPFGMGNAAPLLVSRGVRIAAPPRVIGQQDVGSGGGLRLRFSSGESTLEGLWWGAADRAPDLQMGSVVDVAYRLERDSYFEEPRTVARIVDVRR